MRVSAVVVAAGEGRRMRERWEHSPFAGWVSAPVAKPFLPVNGRPLVVYGLDVLERCDVVDAVVLVVQAGHLEYARSEIVEKFHLGKVCSVVAGGATRQQSVLRGLQALVGESEPWEWVIVHDGVRPLIDEPMVARILEAAQRYGGVAPGMPLRETVKVVDTRGLVVVTPDRRRFWTVQTPQAFRFELLLHAHRRAEELGLQGTDDCALVEAMGEPVRIVPGSPSNIKVTTPEDLVMVEALLRAGFGGGPVRGPEEPYRPNGH